MKEPAAAIVKVCGCGAPIWEGALPHYQELILCPDCGHDHTRQPPLWWRIRWGVRQLRKRVRLLGWRRARELGVRSAFLTYPQREMLKRQRKAEKHDPVLADGLERSEHQGIAA